MYALPQNESLVNRQALEWLKVAKQPAPPWHLHILTLADWGLEEGVEGDWPEKERYALREQVNLLFGWKPDNVLAWLFSNPDGPDDPQEQEDNLISELDLAESPEEAAAFVLNEIWAAQKSRVPALQTIHPD
jgi:hypothetical protein